MNGNAEMSSLSKLMSSLRDSFLVRFTADPAPTVLVPVPARARGGVTVDDVAMIAPTRDFCRTRDTRDFFLSTGTDFCFVN